MNITFFRNHAVHHFFTLFFIAALCLAPVVTSAGYASLYSDLSSSGSIANSAEFVFATNPLATAYTINLGVSAYAGSQTGANGSTFGSFAQINIGPFSQSEQVDPPNGSDPMSVGLSDTRIFTKIGPSSWQSGSQIVGESIFVGGQAGVSGNDSVGTASGYAEVFWLDPTVGTINVTANNPGATWTISGPVNTFGGTGTSANYPNQQTGTYNLNWGSIPGFIPPSTQSFTLSNGGTITFDGTYTPIPAASVNLNFQ